MGNHNPTPPRQRKARSWQLEAGSCFRQALSAKLFSNSLIPFIIFPTQFCSPIRQNAHNRTMQQSSRQLDRSGVQRPAVPAHPRSAPCKINTHPPPNIFLFHKNRALFRNTRFAIHSRFRRTLNPDIDVPAPLSLPGVPAYNQSESQPKVCACIAPH